jgi:hypothetical protein
VAGHDAFLLKYQGNAGQWISRTRKAVNVENPGTC